jgi:hypothetical protein
MDSQLRQISTLVQERRYDAARAALEPYLRDHPDAAYGWYLLSFAAKTPAARWNAIKKAVQLAPENEKYLSRRVKLNAASPPSNTRLLVAVAVVMITVLAVVFVLVRPPGTPADGALPTLAAGESLASSPTAPETAAVAAVASETATIVTATPEQLPAIVTATPTMPPPNQLLSTSAATNLPTISAADIILTADLTALASDILNPATAQALAPLPTANAPTSSPPQPTALVPSAPTSTPSSTPQPGALTATPVLTGEGGVALSTPLDIGAGSMRVISVTRPGSTFITDMGGQPGSLPTGQEWVVVEALVICSGTANCAPNLSALQVAGASGSTYTPATDFSIASQFGPGAFALGQVWGYLGFRIPTTETNLRLILTQGNQTFTFALQ